MGPSSRAILPSPGQLLKYRRGMLSTAAGRLSTRGALVAVPFQLQKRPDLTILLIAMQQPQSGLAKVQYSLQAKMVAARQAQLHKVAYPNIMTRASEPRRATHQARLMAGHLSHPLDPGQQL